jgi:uncharacterized integral membrane protein
MKVLKDTIDIVGVMVLVWGLMLLLLIIINTAVVNLRLPMEGLVGSLVNNALQLVIGGALFLAWLFVWYKATVYCRKRRLRLWSQGSQ